MASDESGGLRVVAPRPTIDEVLWDTVGHIAIYGAGHNFVMQRLRRVLDGAEPHLKTDLEYDQLSALAADLDRRQNAKAIGS